VRTRGWDMFFPEAGEGTAQIMYTCVNKYKNNKIK
jgi:hypothetical protein